MCLGRGAPSSECAEPEGLWDSEVQEAGGDLNAEQYRQGGSQPCAWAANSKTALQKQVEKKHVATQRPPGKGLSGRMGFPCQVTAETPRQRPEDKCPRD